MRERKRVSLEASGGESGIRCRQCGVAGFWFVYRTQAGPDTVRRVRECRRCGHKQVSYERAG